MSPDTVHFLAQMIRHQRALATSAEKWITSPTFSREQALDAVRAFRGVLDSYEAQLRTVETAQTVTQ